MKLILPKTLAAEHYFNFPLFFLAGPIKGAGDWQKQMALLLDRQSEECLIANPCRYTPEHLLYRYRAEGKVDHFPRQLPWEQYYLLKAAKKHRRGCLVFWLARQVEPRDDGQPYARDTYGELGEWRGHLAHNPNLRVVVGAEPDFPGLDVIRRNYEHQVPGFRIRDTMEETVHAAWNLSRHHA